MNNSKIHGDHHKQLQLPLKDWRSWLAGARAARNRFPADPSRNEAYQSGYGFEYALQEMKSQGVFK